MWSPCLQLPGAGISGMCHHTCHSHILFCLFTYLAFWGARDQSWRLMNAKQALLQLGYPSAFAVATFNSRLWKCRHLSRERDLVSILSWTSLSSSYATPSSKALPGVAPSMLPAHPLHLCTSSRLPSTAGPWPPCAIHHIWSNSSLTVSVLQSLIFII